MKLIRGNEMQFCYKKKMEMRKKMDFYYNMKYVNNY